MYNHFASTGRVVFVACGLLNAGPHAQRLQQNITMSVIAFVLCTAHSGKSVRTWR
jgi:hypothetical protein